MLEPWAEGFLVAIWAARGDRASVIVRLGDLTVAQLDVPLGDGGLGSIDVGGLEPDQGYEVTTLTAVGSARAQPGAYRAPRRRSPAGADRGVGGLRSESRVRQRPRGQPARGRARAVRLTRRLPVHRQRPGRDQTVDGVPRAPRRRCAGRRRRCRRLLEAVGVRAIYDDHEFRNNWDPVFVAAEPARYAAAMQVWDELFPIREPIGDIRYRSWRWGANAECFLLDCRRFRSANAAPDDGDEDDAGRGPARVAARRARAQHRHVQARVHDACRSISAVGDDHWVGVHDRARAAARRAGRDPGRRCS